MIDINLWRELAVFEKCGTLSKAAEELFVSQPALSRSMNKLEEELGVIIFTRSKNKLQLNENGKLSAQYAREIIRYEENAINAIKAFDTDIVSEACTIHAINECGSTSPWWDSTALITIGDSLYFLHSSTPN